MNKEEIKQIIPHREPMLLVDEIYLNEDGTATGIYTVKGDEIFLKGHFPNNPIVPGVILCEMASQSSCIILAEKVKGKNTYLTSMNNVKFKKMVTVGDKIVFTCTLTRVLGAVHFMKAVGSVNDELVMSGDFTFVLN